jgi:hypothetical protein
MSTDRRRFFSREAALVGAAAVVMVLPWVYVQFNWGSSVISEVTTLGHQPIWSIANWTFYLRELGRNFTSWFVVLGLAGLVGAFVSRQQRAAAGRVFWTAAILLAAYSLIRLKEARYVIALLPLLSAAIALGVSATVTAGVSRRLVPLAAPLVTVFAIMWLSNHPAPRVSGFREVVDDLLATYPGERFVYDGYYDGNMIYYHRTADAPDRIRLMRGSKVFYATALHKDFGLTEFVRESGDVGQILERIGCRYVLLEREEVVGVEAARIVRKIMTLNEGTFRFLRSYPVSLDTSPRVTQLDLYEFTGRVSDEPDESLMFPALGGSRH